MNKPVLLKIFIFLIFFPLMLFSTGLPAQKKDSTHTVRVAVFPLEPVNFIDRDGTARGLYPDIIREIARINKWNVLFVPGSWSESLARLQNEEIDLMTTIAFSPERARTIDYSKEPVLDIWGQIFILPGSKISDIRDLHWKKVAVMRRDINGANFIKTAEKFQVTCRIVEFASHDEVFDAVAKKTVSAGVAPQHFGLRNAKKYGLAATSIQFEPFSVYFGVKKGRHHDLLMHIDSQILRWKQKKDSYYYRRLNYWLGGREYEKEIIPGWLLVTLGLILAVAALLILMNRILNYRVKKRTRELHVSEEKYRTLVEGSNTIILIMNKDGIISFINSHGLDFFGYSDEEIVGKNITETIVPQGEEGDLDLEKMIDEIMNDSLQHHVSENENVCKNGQRVFVQWSNKAILDDDGKLLAILSVGIDVSRRKKLELELFQSRKMEAIGTLAGGIAHDFNNILSVIVGYADLVKKHFDQPEKANKELEKITGAAIRARDLVEQILAFSRKTEVEKKVFQLSLLAKEVLKMVRSTIPASIEIIENIDSDKKIFGDPTRLHQVVMNLCTNAYQAIGRSGGIISVSLDEIRITEELAALLKILNQSGNYLRLEISDNGSGMDAETLEKIFEPYFTTKEQGKGTGLGLAVVHGIVQEHDGHIRVYSEPGKGTTVNVYLPITGEESEGEIVSEETPSVKGGDERILVVDDEKEIGRYFTDALREKGYTVARFSSSPKALKRFLDDPESFDLAVVDMTMPELSGADLAKEIFRRRPRFPIILCTGFSEFINKEKAMDMGISAYLQKPVLIPDLLKTVREVLDKE